MGYYRYLYAGPVIRIDSPTSQTIEKARKNHDILYGPLKKHEELELFRIFDTINEDFKHEDSLTFLQRVVGGSGLLAPSRDEDEFEQKFGRKLSLDVNSDPELLFTAEQIEEEKAWIRSNFHEELEILISAFNIVEISWAVVIDGS